jgi:hypothetical protein
MKFFIELDREFFYVSKTLGSLLIKKGIKYTQENLRVNLNLKKSNIAIFVIGKPNYYYIVDSNKKYRISKNLYDNVKKFVKCKNKELLLADFFSGTGSAVVASSKTLIKPIFSNDFCPHSKQLFLKNFSKLFNNEDIRNIKPDIVPDHDIFVGGFPCQPFSIAGSKKGFEDQRSNNF